MEMTFEKEGLFSCLGNRISWEYQLEKSEFEFRIKALNSILNECTLCPHHCRKNRKKGELGKCKLDENLKVSSVQLHFGEERPLVGSYWGGVKGGSGTIFFSGCNLKCIFCQNYSISHERAGSRVSVQKLAFHMLELQRQGAHNINLVTPTHQTAKIAESIYLAREMGLALPIVYNCGGFEDIQTLKLLEGIIDIYMPDFKYGEDENGEKFSRAKNYSKIAKIALKEMHRQVGDLVIDKNGIAQRGLLIRHLVLPENLAGSREVLTFIAREISMNSYVNVMGQYRPEYKAYEFAQLNTKVSLMEIQEALDIARELGLSRGLEY